MVLRVFAIAFEVTWELFAIQYNISFTWGETLQEDTDTAFSFRSQAIVVCISDAGDIGVHCLIHMPYSWARFDPKVHTYQGNNRYIYSLT